MLAVTMNIDERIAASVALNAVSVEQILDWAYRREKVHLARTEGMPGMGGGRMGVEVDSSTRLGMGSVARDNMGFEAPRDAYAVSRAVGMLGIVAGRPAAQLVRHMAITGGRPDWTPAPVIRVKRGKAFAVADPVLRHKRKAVVLRGCLFTYSGDVAEVLTARRTQYRTWAEGLAFVHGALSAPGVLTAHVLTGALPAVEPWTKRA